MKPTLTELQVQKLVDGELSDAERCALLQSLESGDDPLAWRTLALGFLEARLLGTTFRTAEEPPAPITRPAKASALKFARQATALAASAMLGVGIVLVGHSWWRGQSASVAQSRDKIPPVVAPSDVEKSPVAPVRRNIESHIAKPVPVMNVNLGARSAGEGPSVSVPVYKPEDWAAAPESHPDAALSTDLQRQLEAQGYRVERVPEWFAAPLEDGGHVLVPTERVRIQPQVN